ncbi:MAG TPA: Crp/Fnr family transcriptional regulator [Clostridia bacterium]|jgi:CRP/FNR family cyclic AMP-dependent transcriptional regulator|nr:Crp/Fnr family transcriptional regulator [Clostridia bacterium]
MQSVESQLVLTPVFRKLCKLQQKELQRLGINRILEKGDRIISYGEIWRYVILIREGIIEARKESEEGRTLVVCTYKTGDVIWGHAMFDGEPTPGTLVAKVPCIIIQWHGNELFPLIWNNNEALWDLCVLLHQRLRKTSNVIEELAFSPTAGRLAKLLLEFFKSEHQASVKRIMTLDEMAARVGTTREVVCRLLYRFSHSNIIQVNRTHIRLMNKSELHKLAGKG